jgi:hypothetical protein
MECISLSSEYVISFGRGRILLALNMGLVWAKKELRVTVLMAFFWILNIDWMLELLAQLSIGVQ